MRFRMTANINDSKNESCLCNLLLVIFQTGGGDSHGCSHRGLLAAGCLQCHRGVTGQAQLAADSVHGWTIRLSSVLLKKNKTKLSSYCLKSPDADLKMTAGTQ